LQILEQNAINSRIFKTKNAPLCNVFLTGTEMEKQFTYLQLACYKLNSISEDSHKFYQNF